STNQVVKQSTPVIVQAQSAPVQQATPVNNNVTTQVAENNVATAPATSTTASEQSQNTQVVNDSEQSNAAQSSTTQKSEEPKVETPVNTADNASQKNVNGNWYLVDNNTGKNLTGFQEIKDQNKVVYYAPSNGQMQYGWQWVNNATRYFDNATGAMAIGQKNINNHWYLFDNNGAMQRGFQNLKDYGQDKTVYYNQDGWMQYGWQNINNSKYYFDKFSGAMTTGQKNIAGSWYLFNNQGVMQTGFQKIANQDKTVHYDSNGKMQYGWQWVDNATRYFDNATGAMATGQKNINNHWYL